MTNNDVPNSRQSLGMNDEMNRDDIIRMAREAGFELDDNNDLEPEQIWYFVFSELERFANAAYAAGAAAEREACEHACDRVRLRYQQWADKTGRLDLLNKADGAQDCIIEIRARGEGEK